VPLDVRQGTSGGTGWPPCAIAPLQKARLHRRGTTRATLDQFDAAAGYQVLTGSTVNTTLTGWTNLLTPCKVNQATPINTDIPVVDPNAAPSLFCGNALTTACTSNAQCTAPGICSTSSARCYLAGHEHIDASIKSKLGDSFIGGNLAARIAPITCP